MGGLKKYLPVTFATMMIGTLAIAGIPPFAGFFSKDEILFRAFLHNKAIWVLAVVTALMTAFYMFRLMAMTFFGAYRGPAWEAAGHGARRGRRRRTASKHPADRARARPGATARRTRSAHGPAEPHDHARCARRARPRTPRTTMHGAGHGHGPWHGPHESPTPMTFPLHGARGRRDRRRLRRHSGGARRRQHDRAFPRAELHGGARRGATARSASRRVAAERARPQTREPLEHEGRRTRTCRAASSSG